jgi:uncharacterized protein (TIGR02217 family)
VTPLDQRLGAGDGVRTAFPLVKTYAAGPEPYVRPIVKPVAGTVVVAVAGRTVREAVEWSVDPTTGIVTFADPVPEGAEVRAGFEFDVPVRFDTDRIAVSVASFQAGDVPQVPVVEVRL